MTKFFAFCVLLMSLASPAVAHVSPDHSNPFMVGFTHPLLGPDHVLVMIAVGLWAAILGQKALWVLPTVFVVAMIGGFLTSLAGMPLPFVEPIIVLSIIAIGGIVALSVNVSIETAGFIVAAIAIFHGHAHGSEIGSAAVLPFGAGFALATMLLHIAGLCFALGLFAVTRMHQGMAITRLLGGVTAAVGVWFAM
ncbi:HupE/UreJ family protein [Cochlodiniinecator piscidefendens]|uniref:HupE/UreJ family protein n=1 Tax=Cochlodiniinecator piscidefendens TaxID=2715756 RepID=UPI00140E26D4|nr:HupE/UreJ family protein [Cochlodiniinecator piscidefendens]